MKRLYLLIILLQVIIWNFGLQAQNCRPSDQLPGPIVCLQVVPTIQGNTSLYNPDLIPEGFCGTIENNGWFRFIACEPIMRFTVVSNNCANGFGVQSLILDKNFQNVSNCLSPGTMGSGEVIADNLQPGEVYYFMIDGYAGDACDFFVTVQNTYAPASETPGKIIGPSSVCVGEQVSYQIEIPQCFDNCAIQTDGIDVDTNFIWTVPAGARVIEEKKKSITLEWDTPNPSNMILAQMTLNSSDVYCGIPACSTCPNQIIPLTVEVQPPSITFLPFVTICEGECYDFGGELYCESGHYQQKLSAANSCDSIVHLNLLVLQDIEHYLGATEICEGDCYTLNGQQYCTPGRYEQTFSAKNGCDSILLFDLKVLSKSSHTLEPFAICDGECVEINDQSYCSTGTYTQQLTNSLGCDSVLNINIRVREKEVSLLPVIEKCEGDCAIFNGQQICSSGVFEATFTDVNGCDSVVVQEFVYRQNNETDLATKYLCKEECFEIAGTQYCETGTYRLSMSNQYGCDSVIQFEIKKIDLNFSLNIPQFIRNGNGGVRLEALQSAFPAEATFTWTHNGAPLLVGQDYIDALEPGIYTLTVNHPFVDCEVIQNVEVFEWNLECAAEPTASFSTSCLDASFICGQELKGFCGDLNIQTANKPGNLQQVIHTNIENNIWLKWSPCADTVQLRIATYDCTNLKGLEFSVLQSDNCQVFHAIINSELLDHMSVAQLEIPNLTPGESYFMMFDGIDGDNCGFQLDLMKGFQEEALEVLQLFPSRISGATKVCADEVFSLSLELPQLAFGADQCVLSGMQPDAQITAVKWHLPDNAIIHGDSTAQTIDISLQDQKYGVIPIPTPGEQIIGIENIWAEVKLEVDLSKEYYCNLKDVIVTVEPKAIQLKREIEHLPMIELCEGESYSFCGQTVKSDTTLICEEDCLLRVQAVSFKSPEIIEHGEVEICPGSCYTFPVTGWKVCEEGYHAKVVLNSCGGYESAMIKFRELIPIATGPRTEICDVLNENYVVSFELVEGIPPFQIEGHQISGNRFVSAPIPSGEHYTFKINDSDECKNELEVYGLYECSPLCPSVAGSMEQALIEVCENDLAKGKYNNDGNLAPGDKFDFVLHDSENENLGVLHGRDDSGEFGFNKQTMEYNKPYYISYVVGPEKNGSVDLSNECLSIAKGQPVVFHKQPDIDAGERTFLDCENGTVRLNGSNLEPYSDYAFEWLSIENNPIQDATSLHPKVSSDGMYYLKATNRNTGCFQKDSVIVSEIENIPHAAEMNFDPPSCFGYNDGQIEIVEVMGGTPPFQYALDDAPFTTYNKFGFLKSGTFELEVKDSNDCVFSQLLTLYEPQKVEVDLGDDIFIGLGDQVELKAASSIHPYRIYWENDIGEEHFNMPNWKIIPTHSMEYRVRIEDRNGCAATDDVMVYVRDVDVYIPSAFSPNGDNKNDRFSVYVGDNVRRVLVFRVYDRGGQKVYEEKSFEPANDDSIGWDGNFRSKPAPSNVYAYVVEVEYINGDIKVYNGDVTLLR